MKGRSFDELYQETVREMRTPKVRKRARRGPSRLADCDAMRAGHGRRGDMEEAFGARLLLPGTCVCGARVEAWTNPTGWYEPGGATYHECGSQ